ncbi:hypothetical protein ACHQM5_030353 [Ranunculus cassubicifolius]
MAVAQPVTSELEAPTDIRKGHLNKYTLAVALLASTNSILLGYDIGVMSGAKLFIRDELHINNQQIDILVGALNVCSIFGSLASGKTSDWIGRRYTIVFSAATFLVGALLMGFAPSFAYLMAGRVIAGIGTGYSLMIAPVYTAEISPASSRGFIGSLPEVFINVGLLLGYVVNFALTDLPKNLNWRLMLGIAAIPAAGIIVGVLLMPESPRWLIMKGRNEEARSVLVRTSEGGEAEADMRLAEILLHNDTAANDWHGEGVWKELILKPTKAVRRILIAAIGLNFFMQASGNDAVVYYTPEVFKAAGLQHRKQQFTVNMIMGLAKTLSVLVSALFLDRFGRRPLLLLGSAGMAVSLTGLGLGSKFLASSVEKPKWAIGLSIVAVCTDVSFFSIGLGPVTWLYSSEIFPMRLRAQGSSIAITVNRLVSGLVTIFFPAVSRKITFAGSFFIFAGVAAVGTVFFYVFLPETKGKNLEDIEDLFDSNRGEVRQPNETTQR